MEESIATYAKLELDPVCMSVCQDYSHWQSPCKWLCHINLSVRIMFLFTNCLTIAQWDAKDLAAFLSSALVTQVSVDIVIDSIPLSQNYSVGGFCFWRGGAGGEGVGDNKTTKFLSPKEMCLIMHYTEYKADYWCSFVETALFKSNYVWGTSISSLHLSYWCH